MAISLGETKYAAAGALDLRTRRPSDESEQEISEVDSEISTDDSVAEEMFAGGEDITLDEQTSGGDSGEEWRPPVGKRQQREEQDSSSSEEEQPPPPPKRPSTSRRSKGRGPGRGRGQGRGVGAGASTSQTDLSTSPEEVWNDVDKPDITPPQPTFRPKHSPGPMVIPTATYTALQLFQLFFTQQILQTITQNTNDYGAKHHSAPSNPWINITVQDIMAFMSLIIYMGIVKCPSFTDYWRRSKLYSLPFPKQIMTGKKFLRISQSLHISSMADDAANEQKRGTPGYNRLAKTQPLYLEIRDACRRNYHPSQNISIDERMVASKARIGLKQYMKSKPVRWGYKLFVLADSSGYTWDFFIYEGKCQGNSGHGLSYESVMRLIDTQLLGTGYKLFVDNFYTSPTLFRDLLQKKIWACGTIRPNRVGFPKTKHNCLVSKSPPGSIRWIRKDSLLFVQWWDVCMCSALHTAHSDDTVTRKVKDGDGHWQMKDIPIPPAVKEYNKYMGGVDLSDSLIGYYKVLHKTHKWYKTFFYHFMDIAIVNAFIIHKEIAKGKGVTPLHQKAFRETLAEELAEASSTGRPTPAPASHSAHHKPVHITTHSTTGRLKCRHCHAKTPVKCSSCDVPLCFVPNRDCYNAWHTAHNL